MPHNKVRPAKAAFLDWFAEQDSSTVWKVAKHYAVSTRTVVNWMKRWGVATPKGFHSRGRKIGRPKGVPMSAEQKSLRSRMFSGKGNPFYGKKHTPETKATMSENHADFVGDKNPFAQSLSDPRKREDHRARCKAVWADRDAEWRKRFGERLSSAQAAAPQTNAHANHLSGWHPCSKTRDGWFFSRSSWESAVADLLEYEPSVQYIEYETMTMPYVDAEGHRRHTRSDFLVTFDTGERLLLEVKPQALAEQQTCKLDGQEEYCLLHSIQYALFTEREVRNTNCTQRLLRLARDGMLHVEDIIGSRCPSVRDYLAAI